MRRTAASLFLTAAFFVAACGGDEAGQSSLLFGDAEGIVEQPVDDGQATTLIAAPSKTDTLRDPSVSPDGSRVAYVHAPPYVRSPEGTLDIHADLWIADRDSSNARMAYEHSRPTETITMPQWIDDDTILAQVTYKVDPTKPGNTNERVLVRINVESGERVDVIENVIAFTISPDGTRIAFTAIKSIEEQPIYIASSDDTEPTVLVDTSSGLDGFSGLVFSADGSTLYFGAHEETGEVRLAARRPLASGSWPQRSTTTLHDGPVNLWAIELDSGVPRLIAEIEATAPHFARGEDGGVLYVLAGSLGRINIATGTLERIADPSVSGAVAFAND